MAPQALSRDHARLALGEAFHISDQRNEVPAAVVRRKVFPDAVAIVDRKRSRPLVVAAGVFDHVFQTAELAALVKSWTNERPLRNAAELMVAKSIPPTVIAAPWALAQHYTA